MVLIPCAPWQSTQVSAIFLPASRSAGFAAVEGYDSSKENPRFHCQAVSIFHDFDFDQHVNTFEQTADKITITYGFMDIVRTIHLDKDAHPDNIEPSRAGHSIGKWEGDTLVVDTIGFTEGFLDPRNGVKHSDQLHTIEKFTRGEDGKSLVQSWVDGGQANNGIVISDPATSNGADFDSSESLTAMNRPKLEVTYTVPVIPPNLPPTASFTDSCTDLDCSFTDTSTDSDGSVVSWAWDFGDGGTSSVQNPSHSYAAAGTYSVELTATDNEGATGVTSRDVTVSVTPPHTDVLATAEIFGSGTVSGTFAATHDDDGIAQSVTERESGGRKQDRYSFLVHTWQFEVPPNALATVHANAWHGGSTDDDFRFSWSTDNSNYTELFVVSSTAPANLQSAMLTPGTSGTVYIRVEDTDQTPGSRAKDTVFVDHLYIRAESAAGDPPAAPGRAAA